MAQSDTPPGTHEGGCLCGAVRYRVRGAPIVTTNCHCSMCRGAAGAPFVTWSEFPAEAVAVTKGEAAWYGSSDAAERGFCAHCGTALFFTYIDADTIDVATATLEDPAAFPPQDHIWTDSKVGWIDIDDGLPAYPRERG
jgi:hypothetical protein